MSTNTIRIKRRLATVGGVSAAPTSLQNAELAFNENNRTLYYGYGLAGDGSNNAAEVIPLISPDMIGTGTGSGATDLSALADVSLSGPIEDGYVLKYNATLSAWEAAADETGGVGGLDELSENLTVALGTGVSVGSWDNGEVIPAGTSLIDVVKGILIKTIPPTYLSPQLSLAATTATTAEVGTALSPTISVNYNQRNGGAIVAYSLKNNTTSSIIHYDNSDPITTSHATNITMTDTAQSFTGGVFYAAGAIQNDNLGNPYPTGSIGAGSLSATITFSGFRKVFYGADTNTLSAMDSDDVRGLASSSNSPAANTSFSISIPAGSRRVSFAYPATIRDVNSIVDPGLGNASVKSAFKQQTISVEGANGASPINYKVYNTIFDKAPETSMSYTVTL
jgi:hypothetical protein